MKSFLQSNLWAEFQKKLGRNVFDVQGIKIIEHKIALNKSFLYSFGVSVIDNFENFINKVKEIAKKENAIFLKIEPRSFDLFTFGGQARDNLFGLKKFGFRKSNNIQPLQTIILDITKTEEELLNQMHQKTRYNIQLAQKRGVKIRNLKSEIKNFEEFWKLMTKTSKRDGFRAYPKEYYQKMLEIPGTELFVAELPLIHQSLTDKLGTSRVIAANIVFFCENQAIYLHGASDYEYRNLMAPHLLQWEQIKEAKRRNCVEYDFWGINETKWPGVTRFKRGFGGKEIACPGAYDLVFKPFWYRVYKILKKIL